MLETAKDHLLKDLVLIEEALISDWMAEFSHVLGG